MNNNIDISLTLGTRADMSGINQVRKGVDDLSTAARGLPRELISGGVGSVADARAFSGASAPGKMTIQVEGLDRLAGTIARAEGVAASGTSAQGRTDKALEEMQSGATGPDCRAAGQDGRHAGQKPGRIYQAGGDAGPGTQGHG